jgi:lipoprotein-anchoring transpeptidase ErfK/SrfK
MSESMLRTLNPGADFGRAGTTISVADVQPMELHGTQHTIEAVHSTREQTEGQSADTIVVDKPAREVRAYTKDGKLLGFYPATIGSDEKPAPTGTFKVRRVAWNPDYHYDPKFGWKNVRTKQKLTIAPGPKNPVGLVWIDLTAPSYGIHGTPEPKTIAKTESHGCIRLTNWDAVDLAAKVHPGTVVKFEDQDSPVVPLATR